MAYLNGKQARFVEEYLIDLNASGAALRAGYSPKSAARLGQDLLAKPHIAHAIHQAKAERSQRTQIEADTVLHELAALAFSDLREVIAWGPGGVALKASACLSPQAARSIQDVVSTKKVTTRVGADGQPVVIEEVHTKLRLYNKVPALLALAQHLDLLRPFTEYELRDAAFIEDFMQVVLKHVTDQAAMDELRAVVDSYVQHPKMRRAFMPAVEQSRNGHLSPSP